jgi:biotin synthase-related radical SAM superfamily protein
MVKNSGSTPVTLDEGCFRAIFIVDGEAKTFLQSVRASYKSGVKEVTINPDTVYEEQVIIHPKDWGQQRKLPPGQYRVRVSYARRDSSWRPGVNREANHIKDGVVVRLDSKEIDVRIK